MLLAQTVLFILTFYLPRTFGNELIDNKTIDISNTYTQTRLLTSRNQTRTRDDQLLSLLATRRRQILQNRFKNHLKNIVEITAAGSNLTSNPKLPLPNRTINVHLNLSDFLHNTVNTSSEVEDVSPSTEINLVNIAPPRSALKPRRNGESQEKAGTDKAGAKNMPIIRNILFRRKMSFLNRKVPLDLEQITIDTLGLSEIHKNSDDLIFDNEDSLQVEESNHDKLIYYDVKNNASKKSGNTFEDASDEIKMMHNRTFSSKTSPKVVLISNHTHANSTIKHPVSNSNSNSTNKSTDSQSLTTTIKPVEVILKIEAPTTKLPDKIQEKTKNTTRFMSSTLSSYFRPLNVPEEEMQPFLHFGEKLPQTNHSSNYSQEEEEIDEHMDVSIVKPIYENKIAKLNHPTQKVSVARDYFKNRLQNKSTTKSIMEVTPKPEKKLQNYNSQLRNMTRNRGFRNMTIFLQQKRNGLRQTIHLRPNSTLADLKPSTIAEVISTERITTESVNTTTYKPKFQLKEILATEARSSEESTTEMSTTVQIVIASRIAYITTTETSGIDAKSIEKEHVGNGTERSVTMFQTTPENTTKLINDSTFEVETTSAGSSIFSSTETLKSTSVSSFTKLVPQINTPVAITATTTTPKPLEVSSKLTTTQTDIPNTQVPQSTNVPIFTPTSKSTIRISYSFETTTPIIPTTRILSTAVVTSVSIESKPKGNHTEEITVEEATNDAEATVVAVLSNFTSQAFQNNTSNSTQVQAYPNMDIPRRNISKNSFPTYPSMDLLKQNVSTNSPTVGTINMAYLIDLNATTTNSTIKNVKLDSNIHVDDKIPGDFSSRRNITKTPVSVSNTTRDSGNLNTNMDTFRNSSRKYPMIFNATNLDTNRRNTSRNSFSIPYNTTKLDLNPSRKNISRKYPIIFNITEQRNRTLFILKPNRNRNETTISPETTRSKPDFIIHVPDLEIATQENTTPELETTSVTTKIEPITEFKLNNTSKTEIELKFNTTPKPETELKLPIATLFSIIDFNRPTDNATKIYKIPGTETVISRKETDPGFDNVHAAYILAALGFVPMMVIVIYVVRSVLKRKNKIIEDFEAELHDSEKKTIINPVARLPALVLDSSNRWEFPRSKLRLQTLLGQGNFGQVWKAEADDLKGHVGLTRLVAVKTIKDGAGSKERDDLLKELALMQKMGSHPNVVTLLGCCTDKEPYLLIMEYVMYGKLLTFLRDHRTRRDYYNFSDDAATLTARDLTVFAYCVARGMEYLASKGIIHRDLAARNILVDHNKLCKIADFGMSREAPLGEVAEPRQPRNALPVRWMAIESLMYSVFTHKSDVWAFGVLLWEIVTLGSSPYANMSGREVMRLVCDGYRLERPNHCKPELYMVMARTWHADPAQRPSFADLRNELAEMLENTNAGEGSYVDLESFRADSTVYEIDNCTPRGNYFTVKSRFSEFECDI